MLVLGVKSMFSIQVFQIVFYLPKLIMVILMEKILPLLLIGRLKFDSSSEHTKIFEFGIRSFSA